MIRLLIADDHAVFRSGLCKACADEPELQVVGEAHMGQEAVDLTAQLRPDIVLMDLELPGLDGVQVTRLLTARFPEVRIVILTAYRQDEYVLEAMRAGAQGFLLKGGEMQELVQAVRHVYAGGAWIAGA